MRKLLWIIVIVAACMPAQSFAQQAESQIRAVLDAQVAAWNAGDIDGFMQGYENSPRTTFIGKSVRHGYAEILANYKSTYSSRQKMGTLAFSDLDVRRLCPTNAVVTGKFKLTFAGGAPPQSGVFSLVWAKTAQDWQIVLDHTSSDAP